MTSALCFATGVPSRALISILKALHMCELSIYLPPLCLQIGRLDGQHPSWPFSFPPSRPATTHSFMVSSCAGKGLVPAGVKEGIWAQPLPSVDIHTLDSQARKLMLTLVGSLVASLSQSWATPSLASSFSLPLLWNNQSILSAQGSPSFLLRAKPGHHPAGQTSSTFNDNNNNLHLYKVFHRGILKCITNNN